MKTRLHVLHPALLTVVLVNAALFAGSLWALHTGSKSIPQFFREDGFVEWLQFLAFAALSALLGVIAWSTLQQERRISLASLGMMGLSAVVALAALEEVSWFQRVIGIVTPEFFQKHNRQGETNLHNLALGGESVNKRVLVKLMFIVGIAHNLVLPLLARRYPAIRRRIEALGGYLPPLSVAASYLLLVALSQVLLDHPRRGELSEVFGALHYLSTTFAAYVIGIGYDRQAVFRDAQDRSRVAALFSLFVVFLVLIAWLLGVGYLR